MTKTPEELTEDWKAKKLPQWRFYYVFYSGGIEPLLLNGENDFINHSRIINHLIKKILAPVPSYDEYKAIQDELAEHRHYCCCMENEVMRLDKAKLEEENKQLRALLKECQNYIINTPVLEQGSEQKTKQIHDLLTRINEVINE